MLDKFSTYRLCYMIRKTEEAIEKLFSEGKLFGTTHCCIGQEIIPVSILPQLKESDTVTSTHRSHGHFLSMFPEPKLLIGELMGKEIGVNQGKCGSQHLQYKNFYTNGITGGMIPIGTGIAYSNKLKGNDSIVISFLGDGALNEGYVLESFNFACVNSLPIIYVIENNQYAMSTKSSDYTSKSILNRVISYGFNYYQASTNYNLNYQLRGIDLVIDDVRRHKRPAVIVFDTFRFCGHSKSDKCEYIDKNELELFKKYDYLTCLGESIYGTDGEAIYEIERSVNLRISEALEVCENAEFSNPLEVYVNEIR